MKRSFTKMLNCLRVTIFTLLVCTNVQAQRLTHPGIPFTRYDLDQLKVNITKEPWLSAYNSFKGDSHSQLSYGMKGPFATVTRAPNLNNTAWIEDMTAIHHLAFMWWFTGDSSYARKATDMLDAWAVTNNVWGGNESMLDIGDYVQYWATAADILKSTFPGWTDANTSHVKNYFANVLYPTSWVPYQLRDANKGALQLKIALGAAAFCDDAVRFNQAIDVYRMDAGGGMRNSLPNGEVGDAGRDDHWRVQAAALAWGAEVAYKQGIDMYAELGNRVLAIGELYHKYAFVGDTMTFIPLGGYASYWTNWGIPTGARRGDMTNIIQGAYALRKGIPTPYTDMMRAALGGAGGDFLYLKSSDTSTAAVLPPVYYPAEHVQPVSYLTNTDIGSPGIAGSASYSNGVWTVKAAGNSRSNALNYTFKKISGDAGLVVKVNSMSLSSAGCGAMIRQSLAPGAPYWDIYLAATGGIGPHWQPKAPWWLKIERVGNRIFTYHSQDGVNWTGLNCFYTDSGYPTDLYYGFYTISNNTSALNTAVFSNVGFSQAAPAGSPVISSATTATVKAGAPFSYSITASGNPATYSASGLPAGLTLDAATGIISGTPTALGQSEVTLGATNSNGTGTATLILNVTSNTAPTTPDSAVAAVVNTTQIRLTWKPSANATSYSVKRSLTSGGPYTTLQTGITGNSFTDATPVPEVNNYYVISALADQLESGLSNEVFGSVPPAIPGKPTVTNKNGEVDLKWDTTYGASSYNVKRGTVSGGPYTTIATVTSNSYADLNVTNGSPYYYVISALGATKESANSPEAYAVPGSNSLTWSTDADSAIWSNGSSWIENSVPQSPAILTFKSSADTVITNDLTSLAVSRIQFDADASQYTIGGNGIALNNDLVNNSTKLQTITTPLVLNSQLSVATNTADVTLSGAISGTGSVRKTGSGILNLSGNNTYSGGTTITGSIGGWPPSNGIAVSSNGTGTPSNATSGPLGTGKITFNGGGLWAVGNDVTIYNDVEAPQGQTGWFFECCYALNLRGKLTGSGTFIHDGNVYAGLHLFADNSAFTGTFISKLRSGNSRTCFEVPESGSAKAHWLLDANGNDCHRVLFSSGTLNFGDLNGRGFIRNDAGGSPLISIGALNTDCNFSGIFDKYFLIEKVGTGTLYFSGNHTYGGTTTIKNGTFLLTNSATSGTFPSPVIDSSGTFGGTGLSQGTVTIGTGTAATAMLQPGNKGIGTFTTTSSLTINSNGIYNAEVSIKNATADKMKAAGVSLVSNPVLSVTVIDSGALALGTSFTILENTGTNAISGTFKNLPEMSIVKIGSYDFRITYKGGDGNDLALLDDRTIPMVISSAETDTALVGRPYQYTITGIKSPSHFNASGLPAGLSVDTTTGVISGAPSVYGNFNVVLTAANDTLSGTDTLRLVVLNNVTSNIMVAEGDARVVVEWNSILNLTYKVKRATSQSGPFTVIGNTTTARYADSLLTNGTTYYYTVTAVDGSTSYPESNPVAATPRLGQWGYWKFNDSTGTKAVDSWGARHGTLTGGTSSVSGLQGKAVQLNGSNGYVALPTGVMSSLNDFTIAGWVKLNASSTWARIFDFGTGTTNYMFLTPLASTNVIRYAIKVNGGTEQQINSTSPLPAGDWHHVAVTLSGSVGTLYVDGVAVGTNSSMSNKPSALGATTLNYIGRSQFSADPYLNSVIDEFRIYNRALSATELKTVYAQYAPPLAPTNLVVTTSNSKPALSWTASASATTYNVKRANTLAGPYATIATATSASYTDSVAASCATYFYMVSAGNSNGESPNSAIATAVSKKLTGTVIGTAGAFGTSTNTKEKAVDGSLTTYFDGPTANGVWVGYDLGADSTKAVYKVRYAPRSGFGSRMTGGVFQGANVADFSTATTLYTITATPVDGVYAEQMITSPAPYRYVRYLSPNNGYGNVAEVEFYGIPSAAAPQITSKAGTKNLSYGATFGYTIPAANANNFTAAGLPNGLSVNTCTGEISGTLNAAGSYAVILTASGMLGSAKDTMLLNIKKDQTITFNALQQKQNGDADFDAGALASSGLPVSYTSSDTTVARIVNGLVHIAGRGTTTITASQSGDSVYKAATAVTQQLVIYQLPTVITQNIQVFLDTSGKAAVTPQQVDNGSVSYSGNLSVSLDKTSFTCADIGAPITVTLTATDADGHSNTGTAQVTVTDNQLPLLTAPAAQVFCYSASGSYTVPALNASDNCGIAAVSYTVSGATSRSGSGTDASGAFTPGQSTITWTVTDVHGNASTATTAVTVDPALSVSIPDVYALNPAVDIKNTIYLGYGPTSLTVTASPAGGTAPYTFRWNTGETTASIPVSQAGTYTVAVTDPKGCTNSASIVINILDVRCGADSGKVTICHNNHIICVAQPAVQTHLDHGDHLGACGARMDVTDAEQTGVSNRIVVYPNPSQGQFIVKLEGFKPGKAAMMIMDGNGKLLQQSSIVLSVDKQTVPVNLDNCATGIYFLRIITNGETKIEKLIIKR